MTQAVDILYLPFWQILLVLMSGSFATTPKSQKVCIYTKDLISGEITFRGLYERATRGHKDLCQPVMKKIAEVSSSPLAQWSNNMRQAAPARKLRLMAMITLKGHRGVISAALILLIIDKIHVTIPTNERGFHEIQNRDCGPFKRKHALWGLLD